MNNIELKAKALQELHSIVDEKIRVAQAAVSASEESRDNETKSSAGDKHETGRAMVQIEQERNSIQLSKAMVLKNTLAQLKSDRKYTTAILGSMVTTNQGVYFLSIGIGKLQLEETTVFAISPGSPVGQLMLNKKTGNNFPLAGKKIEIKDVS